MNFALYFLRSTAILLLVSATAPRTVLGADSHGVKLWQETITIPTYHVAPPDPNPRFYQGRTYQGARATFYPYPVMDRLTDDKAGKPYKAVYLENEFIQISVLPELGGRIFTAKDKGNGYDFFYRQHVIKPALIGMLGAWISGGVEWNIPHHHRATSFMPVDYSMAEGTDGSQTVWVGETELRHGLKWLVGLTLYPDRSYIEMSVKVFNGTPFSHPILFWINPAVHANESYQVLFPPSTEWTTQHSKPEFASWPIARQVYGGTDYTRGVDISWWKNHPSPVSFFAWNSEEDWFGGYDHGKQAGVLHWADRHVVPGKKFFEWGNGPEGEMWSDVLTDDDGPYLELMAGAWSDNQPDYSWLQPGEVREWKHWWYPIRDMRGVKHATRDAAVHLETTHGAARIALNTTKPLEGAEVRFESGGEVLFSKRLAISPAKPFQVEVPLGQATNSQAMRISLHDADGTELLAYQPAEPKGEPMPKPVERPKSPKDYATADELYFTGQRVEQLYSPAFEATSYYEEILRRDGGDYRANTALGILLCRQWRWEEAAGQLSNALGRATANYIRPQDGAAAYYLGLALQSLGKVDAAYDWFYKAAWSRGWDGPAYYALAQIQCGKGEYTQALDLAGRSVTAGANNTKALNLKTTILRKLERWAEARDLAGQTLALDPLDFRALNELSLVHRHSRALREADEIEKRLISLMRGEVQSYLELALEYAGQGCWREAMEVLESVPEASARYPMVAYCLAHFASHSGRADEADGFYKKAAQMPPDYCFPSRHAEAAILQSALKQNPQDGRAAYYLGNAFYDQQPAVAIAAWEQARKLDSSFALVHRNLGLAYAQHQKNVGQAIASLEKAVELNPKDPRYFYELDVQYEAGGVSPARRLDLLNKHRDVVELRDDVTTRWIVLLTVAGQSDEAMRLLGERHFRNWEGSGELHDVYVNACLQRGLERLRAGRGAEALKDFEAALQYPRNQEVGKSKHERRAAEIHFHIGRAHEALGAARQATAAYQKAANASERAPSESQYCKGLALRKIGRPDDADRIFSDLVKHGLAELERSSEAVDYFAKFGEKRAERLRLAQAEFLAGLGYLGQARPVEANARFAKALELNPAHLGALTARNAASR